MLLNRNVGGHCEAMSQCTSPMCTFLLFWSLQNGQVMTEKKWCHVSLLSFYSFFYVLVILFCPLATDWLFASTHEGQRVPFATAGDCFSAARCPQVRTTMREGISVHQHCSNLLSGQHSLHSIIVFSFKTEPCQSSLNVAATKTHSSYSSSWKGNPQCGW